MKPLLHAGILLFLYFFIPFYLFAQPGTLSLSFGNSGKLTDPARQYFEKAIASQPDKKILIGSQGFYQGYQAFLVDRLLPDGNKDASFAGSGTAFVLFHDGNNNAVNSNVSAIARLADGRIVAAGHADGNGGHIALCRLLPDGTTDSFFGSNGISLTGFNMDEALTAMAFQPDGKLVICGTSMISFLPGDNRFFVARYLSNGSKDSSFGNNGIVVSSYSGMANAVAVQPDGNIIAGGYNTGTSGISFHIERYQSNGSYDNSFGSNGIVDNFINGGFLNFINDIALQKDGRIVAGGRTNGGGTQTFVVVRYNSNGSFDNSFGNGGVVTTSFPNAAGEAEKIMLTDKDDHIIATGNRTDENGGDFVVVSYRANGLLDSLFGDGGIQTTDFGGSDFDNSATMCADGKIVALGSNTGQFPFPVRALAQYNGYPVSVSLFVRLKQWLHNHVLSWNGLSPDDNIAYYTVEQSSNNRNGFAEVGRISGNAHLKDYSFTNAHLLPGANYYRIKAVGADGSIKYSEVVKMDNLISSLSVYPNPARDVIVVKGLKPDVASNITIANSNGNVMISGISKGSEQHRFIVSSLLQGTYSVNVVMPDGRKEVVRFVKE